MLEEPLIIIEPSTKAVSAALKRVAVLACDSDAEQRHDARAPMKKATNAAGSEDRQIVLVQAAEGEDAR